MTEPLSIEALLEEFAAAQAYSLGLVARLDDAQVRWRPSEQSSSMAWHLGHQAAVNHFMVRNLTAAEPTFNSDFDAVFDSATVEPDRGNMPPLEDIVAYRTAIAASTAGVALKIDSGEVGAPDQLAIIVGALLRAIINHEYQHAKWMGEVRATMTDEPDLVPASSRLLQIDGYYMVAG